MNGFTKQESFAMKGAAVLLLLFHHLYCDEERFAGYVMDFRPFSESVIVKFGMELKLCVTIFAFITGYGLLLSLKSHLAAGKPVAKWSVSRLIKTLSGFWFVYILCFLITMLLDRMPVSVYFSDPAHPLIKGIVYLLADFLGLSRLVNAPSLIATWWYMGAVVLYISFVPLIRALAEKTGYLPILIVSVLLPRLLLVANPGGTNPYTFFSAVLLGMMFAEYRIFERTDSFLQKNRTRHLLFLFLLLIGMLFESAISFAFESRPFWALEYCFLPLFVILFLKYYVICLPGFRQVLFFLGRHSFTIFLTHNFIRYVYCEKFIYSFRHFLIVYAVLTLTSVALAVVIDGCKALVKWDALIRKITAAD